MGRDIFHQTRLLKAPSNLALNTAKEGAAKIYVSNLCRCFSTLTVKNFFLMSNLNLSSSMSFSLTLLWQRPVRVASAQPDDALESTEHPMC